MIILLINTHNSLYKWRYLLQPKLMWTDNSNISVNHFWNNPISTYHDNNVTEKEG